MTFEELVDDLRQRRRRIIEARFGTASEEDVTNLMVDQALYDSRLIQLARMLDVPVPMSHDPSDNLYADHRYLLEDRVAEAGVDLRR